MSLRSQLRSDLQANLTADGDTVTLISGDTTEYTVKGKVTRIEEQIDPDTGARFNEPVTAVSVSLADLDGNEPDDSWTLSTTDSEGNVKTTKAIDRRFDYTLGFVKFYFEDYS